MIAAAPRGNRRIRRAAVVAGSILAMAAMVAAIVGVWFVRRPLPARDGTWVVAGLESAVEVSFDAAGIPHVRSETERDAWRALGWLHANDRFFQMEIRRRAGAGRLAEIFGSAAVEIDREARRGGFARLAAEDATTLSEADREVVEAYAGGVNAFLESRPLPLEMQVMGLEPEPWSGTDSLTFGWQLYASLSDSESREVRLLSALRAHGPEAVSAALEASGESPGGIAPEISALPPPVRAGLPVPFDDLPRAASNAWAVSPARSATGAPLLASDPHLGADYPSIWYVAHLESADGLNVAGLTLAGAPGVFIGHNGSVAWGITMQQADDADLFLEDLDPDGLTTRQANGDRAPVDSREEIIRVRGEEPVRETVLHSHRGTVHAGGPDGVWWSVSWSPTSFARHALSAFLGFDRARDGSELGEAARTYGGPPINIVWADTSGRIGMRTAGSIPVRAVGNGRIPVPAWTGDHDWRRSLTPDELPRIEDPPEGFVVSGNDDWSESGATLPYPGHWASPFRVRRLREVLSSLDHATLDDFRELQNDLVSGYAVRVASGLRDLADRGGDVRRAVEILSAWDGAVRTRGPAALLYPFLIEVRRATFEAREERAGTSLPAGWAAVAAMVEGSAPPSLWDDPETDTKETREAILADALARTLRAVEAEDGPDPSAWNWGRLHRLTYRHPFSSRLPFLGGLLDPDPVELPGEWHNPRVAGFALGTPGASVRHIASARLLVDLAEPDRSRVVLPLGQSSHVGDPHRLDHLPVWTGGRDFPLPFTPPAVRDAAVSTLRLVPPKTQGSAGPP